MYINLCIALTPTLCSNDNPLPIHVAGVVGAGGLEDHEGALEAAEVEGAALLEAHQPIVDDFQHVGVQCIQLLVLRGNYGRAIPQEFSQHNMATITVTFHTCMYVHVYGNLNFDCKFPLWAILAFLEPNCVFAFFSTLVQLYLVSVAVTSFHKFSFKIRLELDMPLAGFWVARVIVQGCI